MLNQIDVFLRNNIANSAILCVSEPLIEEFALFAVKCYLQICCISAQNEPGCIKTLKIGNLAGKILERHPYLCKEMLKIYKNISVEWPPLKILESLVVHPQELFIPVFTVALETRRF